MSRASRPAQPRLGAGRHPDRVAEVSGELNVTELASRLGASVATTSHHLCRLRRAGLVTSRRDGTRITNRVAGAHVLDLCVAADEIASAPQPATAGRRR